MRIKDRVEINKRRVDVWPFLFDPSLRSISLPLIAEFKVEKKGTALGKGREVRYILQHKKNRTELLEVIQDVVPMVRFTSNTHAKRDRHYMEIDLFEEKGHTILHIQHVFKFQSSKRYFNWILKSFYARKLHSEFLRIKKKLEDGNPVAISALEEKPLTNEAP